MNHCVRFNDNIEDFIAKETSDCSAEYTMESLRYAFSRISADNILCILTMNNEGLLSVKCMNENKIYMSESLILSQ